MLKRGQIKFTKKAAKFAEEYFKEEKIETFLIAMKRGEQKPSGYRGFYKQLLGKKQDPSSIYKVYTNNIQKAKKLFETLLIKECRLSCILSPKFNCLLYISKDQKDKLKKIISPDVDFPKGLLNESNSSCMQEFERKMNKMSAVDLVDLILQINNEKNLKNSEMYSGYMSKFFNFIDNASQSLNLWINFFRSLY